MISEDKNIVDEFLDDFKELAAIPRPSLHEKAVSDYLLGVFRALGCNVYQDAANNVIADRPASAGFEDVPRVILQAHMDMVCVAAEGIDYDPLHDPIHLLREGDELTAEGTSLGADDGAGIAMILYVFRHAKDIGPLRAIITTDEETGMSGAEALDDKYLTDADFLINWDSENYDELTRGSAGSVGIDFIQAVARRKAPEGKAWRVTVGGMLGGHSGERIGDGRGNALRILAQTLHAIRRAGLSVSVASLTGGSARNAIAAEAEAVIVTEAETDEIRRVISDTERRVRRTLGEDEQRMTISLIETISPAQVMEEQAVLAVMDGLLLLHTGVFQMSRVLTGLVETSSNLGILRTEDKKIWFSYYARSSIDEKLGEIAESCRILGGRLGLEVQVQSPAPGWRERKKSALADAMAAIFEEQNHAPMKVGVIHAGLECGWYAKKAPKLDIVSIGVTTHDIHSPEERLDLVTVAPQIRLVMETLQRIARGECQPYEE